MKIINKQGVITQVAAISPYVYLANISSEKIILRNEFY